jgi:hypothetical protein
MQYSTRGSSARKKSALLARYGKPSSAHPSVLPWPLRRIRPQTVELLGSTGSSYGSRRRAPDAGEDGVKGDRKLTPLISQRGEGVKAD